MTVEGLVGLLRGSKFNRNRSGCQANRRRFAERWQEHPTVPVVR